MSGVQKFEVSKEVSQTEVVSKEAAKAPYNPFGSPDTKSDAILEVEGHTLHVSKVVLSLASPVFEKMFEGDFKERSLTEIPLPHKSLEDMVEFLLCVYPSTNKPISQENIDRLLPLAEEYQVQSLKDRCEAFVLTLIKLQEQKPSTLASKELVHYIFLADTYKLGELLRKCIPLTKCRVFTGIRNSLDTFTEYGMLSAEVKCHLLSTRLLYAEKRLRFAEQFVKK